MNKHLLKVRALLDARKAGVQEKMKASLSDEQ